MKKLTLFSIKSFVGPFIATFLISMFMLIMQFTWKYIDDLMGKGLDFSVILELMFYVSASLIPLALPLAILLSSIMTLGNLAENNELTALKASGLSLFKILKPLTNVIIIIAIGTFYFANYVIPVANYKWHSLIFDIQETKVSLLLTPGSYSKEIDGYAIKVEKGYDNSFVGVTIHDYTDPSIIKTVKADSATIFRSERGDYLLFRLSNGKVFEEMSAQSPIFQPNGKPIHRGGEFRPSRRTTFDIATYKMDLTGFNLNRSDEEMFKDDYEMLNVFQISDAKDSLQKEYNKYTKVKALQYKNNRPFLQSVKYEKVMAKVKSTEKDLQAVPGKVIELKNLSKTERLIAINSAIVGIRSLKTDLVQDGKTFTFMQHNYNKFQIESHRKFALSFTVIVLFFVGAPLGAIVRKGGFGAPVVIAALLFMVYFVLFSIGENLANTDSISPFWGMWMPTVVLSPIALILMLAAANDLGVFDKKLWRLIFSLGKRR